MGCFDAHCMCVHNIIHTIRCVFCLSIRNIEISNKQTIGIMIYYCNITLTLVVTLFACHGRRYSVLSMKMSNLILNLLLTIIRKNSLFDG